MFECRTCETAKSLTEYHKNPQNKSGLEHRCKQCRADLARARYFKDVDKSRARQKENQARHRERRSLYRQNSYAKQRYGVSGAELAERAERLRQEQNGRCAVCRKKGDVLGLVKKAGVKERRLVMDHDHKTGLLRDLLCDHCNKALGNVFEDPQIIEALLMYVRKWST